MCLDFARGYCPNGEEVRGREGERMREKQVSILYFVYFSVQNSMLWTVQTSQREVAARVEINVC